MMFKAILTVCHSDEFAHDALNSIVVQKFSRKSCIFVSHPSESTNAPCRSLDE